MRYKEFNTAKVLEQCIGLFWQNGYNSCSIKQIVEATGVNRFSLYNEFENKDGILEASLDLYADRYIGPRMKILDGDGTARETLKAFFESFVGESKNHPPGCYTIYIASELADTVPTINSRLKDYLGQLEEKFTQVLNRDSTITGSHRFLATRLCGLFCNSMCFCVIQDPDERIAYIENSFNLIFNN